MFPNGVPGQGDGELGSVVPYTLSQYIPMSMTKLFAESGFFGYRPPYADFQVTDKETLRFMGSIGVNPVVLSPMNTASSLGVPYSSYPPIWRWLGVFDFDLLDRQFQDVVDVYPGAEFLVIVDLNSPLWLARKMSVDSFYDVSECALDEQWCSLMLDFLRRFLEHCETVWKERIQGYVLASGRTQEWIEVNAMKAGLHKSTNYPRWCEENHLPLLPIPNGAELRRSAHGMVCDPVSEAHLIQWRRYSCSVTADLAIRFMREARKLVRPEVKLGYFFGHVVSGARTTGHNDAERAFRNAPPDFQIGAACNCSPDMGAAGGDIGVERLNRRYGVHYVHEIDRILTTSNLVLGNGEIPLTTQENPIWKRMASSAEDIACIRRETAFSLIRQHSLWWFNIWGNSFRSSEVRSELTRMKTLWDTYASRSTGLDTDILVVFDPESAYYVNQEAPECVLLRRELSHSGLAFETAVRTDLEQGPLPERFKFIIFHNPVMQTTESLEALRKNVLRDGRTVLWLFGPGAVTDGKFSPETVESLTGFPFGTPGVVKHDFGTYRSIYAYDAREVEDAGKLLQMAQEAGCHRFAEGIEHAYWASAEFLMIHTAKGGHAKIHLKSTAAKVTELFSGQVVAENTDVFEADFNAPDTQLYYLEK